LSVKKPSLARKTVPFRKLANIDRESFEHDLSESAIVRNPCDNILDITAQYNLVMSELLEKHAPITKKVITLRPNAPWYNDSIRCAKQERRKAERKWRSTKLQADRESYQSHRKVVNNLLQDTRRDYYAAKINDSSDPKALFKTANRLLHRAGPSPLPSHSSSKELADKFANLFSDKIEKIRCDIIELQPQQMPESVSSQTVSHPAILLDTFRPATEEEVRKLILASASKSCPLDPIPTSLLKDNLNVLLPSITKVINLSLASGVVPNELKDALVMPLLKKASLDPDNLKNFRPVSNLSYLSKLIERVVSARLLEHMDINDLHVPLQSAYKAFHSTETALVKVQNDILCAVDRKEVVLLLLLDLSAAFDTVDHSVMLARLENQYGVSGTALLWFRSYLTNRKQTICIEGEKSKTCDLDCGVPQGSVLGPLLFTAYASPLADIVNKHRVCPHFYADDSQLYTAFKPTVPATEVQARSTLHDCAGDVRTWMAANFLKLNDDKSEFMIIGTPQQLTKVTKSPMQIGNFDVEPKQSARNIGGVFDSHMNMHAHVDSLCRSAWYHLYNIGRIRKYMDMQSTERLVHAFVSSRLDNLNSLLYGLPSNQLHKIQRVQNAAAKLVVKARKFDHVTPIFLQLHWLPIEQRIDFKVLLLTFRALHGTAPAYICDMVQPYQPTRSLRSDNQELLVEPRTKLVTYGDRAFSAAAPRLWNNLPLHIKQSSSVECFKRQLKTFLFKQCFQT
jgi:hypothetical protein